VGADGILFLLQKEIDEMSKKFNSLLVSAVEDWQQLEAALSEIQVQLEQFEKSEEKMTATFEKELQEHLPLFVLFLFCCVCVCSPSLVSFHLTAWN
jgi:hypothetical protein